MKLLNSYSSFKTMRYCLTVLVTVWLMMVSACSQTKQPDYTDASQIEIGEDTYTVSDVREHLLKIFSAQEKSMRLALWLPEMGGIKYALAVSKDLDVPLIRKVFAERMSYLKKMSGVNFVEVVKDGGKVNVMFTITSSLAMIRDLEFVRFISKADNIPEDEYERLWQKKDDTKFTPSYYIFIEGKSYVSKAFTTGYALAAIAMDSSKVIDGNDLNGNISSQIYTLLIATAGISKLIMNSNATRIYKKPPYLWPFDQALLKIMYSNKELSGMPVKNGVEVIVAKLYDTYGVKK